MNSFTAFQAHRKRYKQSNGQQCAVSRAHILQQSTKIADRIVGCAFLYSPVPSAVLKLNAVAGMTGHVQMHIDTILFRQAFSSIKALAVQYPLVVTTLIGPFLTLRSQKEALKFEHRRPIIHVELIEVSTLLHLIRPIDPFSKRQARPVGTKSIQKYVLSFPISTSRMLFGTGNP